MAILGQNVDYTDKDFDSILERAFLLIESVFPQWTSRQVANFGNLLVELISFDFDVISKYQDNQARESRWSVATQRKNLIALAKLIGYEPATATASQVDVILSRLEAGANDLQIPADTTVRTKSAVSPIKFRLLSDAVIAAGQTETTVTAENSEPVQDVFTSTGGPNQELKTTATPYIDGSMSIFASNGYFVEVDNFLDSDSTDKHFTVAVDQNDRATVRFGDGVSGQIPTGTITVDYSIGGGTTGQVESGTVTVIEGTFFPDNESSSVQVLCTNPSASTPATNRHTVEQIRQLAPLTLRVLNRTVSREDYEINALRLSAVARALMLTSNEDSAIGENQGFLFIVPVGGGDPTQALKDSVLEQVTVTYPNTLTFQVTVAGPTYLSVDVYAVVYPRKGTNLTTLDTLIRSNLESFFSIQNSDGTNNESIDFGYGFETVGDVAALPLSDVFNVVRDTAGVLKMGDSVSDFTLNGEHSDVAILLREFPVLGTVTLINGDTGSALV